MSLLQDKTISLLQYNGFAQLLTKYSIGEHRLHYVKTDEEYASTQLLYIWLGTELTSLQIKANASTADECKAP